MAGSQITQKTAERPVNLVPPGMLANRGGLTLRGVCRRPGLKGPLNARDRLKVRFPNETAPVRGDEAGPSGGMARGAARDVRLQPIISGSPPLFTFAHRPNFKARRLDRDDVPE
jgi:hypothetical protein